MVSTDHSEKASFFGARPALAVCAAISASAASLPASQACLVGTREGSKP